ncbi:archaetidylserine decarboxylase [Salinispirillum marinum]|uniref:Phosphatidylserine decarboxylase proenzyme n=2 Tax=Saccharospirillaceae TaxID=255527 RepID=A0ABV8BDY6_9GAMM
MSDALFVALQKILPQHALSRLVGKVAHSERAWLAQPVMRWFAKKYQVNMSEAAEPELRTYKSFNAFFTRALRDGARPFTPDSQILICPVDGAISQSRPIAEGRIFQAKGHDFSTQALLGRSSDQPTEYDHGLFSTIYLSPKDYHRIHLPCAGKLTRMTYIPGQLFSVNPATTERVDGLFARNERVVCEFDTEHGSLAMVLVGAMIVASIATVWAGTVAPGANEVRTWHYGADAPTFKQGDEIGRFLLGSTVVVLTEDHGWQWQADMQAGQTVRLGQTMAKRP